MKKLIIEISFKEDISKDEQYEVSSHLSGLIAEEFIYYSEYYPEADVTTYFKEDKYE